MRLPQKKLRKNTVPAAFEVARQHFQKVGRPTSILLLVEHTTGALLDRKAKLAMHNVPMSLNLPKHP